MGVGGCLVAAILVAGSSVPRAHPSSSGSPLAALGGPCSLGGGNERQGRGQQGHVGGVGCWAGPLRLLQERGHQRGLGSVSPAGLLLVLRGGKGRPSKDFWIDPVQHQREPGRARPLPRHMQAELDEKTFNCTEAIPHDSREAKEVIAHPEKYQFWDPDTCEELDASALSNRIPQVVDEEAYLEAVKPNVVARRLWDAATVGDNEEIELIAAYLDADANAADEMIFNFTALHWAALNGHTHTVKLLLSLGARANAPDFFGSTPMHYAADRGHEDVVRELLLGGARPFLDNACGRTPLHWADDARVEAELAEERADGIYEGGGGQPADAAARATELALSGSEMGGGGGEEGGVGGEGVTFALRGRNAVRRMLRRAMGLMLTEDLKEPVAKPVCSVDDIVFTNVDPDRFPEAEAGWGADGDEDEDEELWGDVRRRGSAWAARSTQGLEGG